MILALSSNVVFTPSSLSFSPKEEEKSLWAAKNPTRKSSAAGVNPGPKPNNASQANPKSSKSSCMTDEMSFFTRGRACLLQNLMGIKEIKGREEGRPLAPTILECSAPEFFSKKVCGPHMTLNYQLTKSKLEAVRHVDGSTRPQILKYKDNPLYYEQIKAIEKETGVNAVLNTSLNLHEPIINTPQEALNLLERTKVDAIIFNNTFIAYRK